MKKILEVLSRQYQNPLQMDTINIAFLGDSVTHGAFESYMKEDNRIGVIFDHEAVYHFKLKKLLNRIFPAARINIINAGIGGDNAQNGLKRLENDVIRYDPKLVVVCYGLNDVHNGREGIDIFSSSLRGIFNKLKEKEIETIYMSPNMMNTYVSNFLKGDLLINIAHKTAELQNSGVMDFYMKTARDVCVEESITFCDCYQVWKNIYKAGADVTLLLSNYINHPTREMHDIFAYSLFETIISCN